MRDHKIPLQKVRVSLKYVMRELGQTRPLLTKTFETDGVSLFITHFGKLIDVSKDGQTAMRTMLSAGLKRIERDPAGLARAFSPWRNHVTEPQTVIVDPRIAFGRLTVKGTGIRVGVLHDRWQAGESMRALAEDYDIALELVEAAARWGDSVRAAA